MCYIANRKSESGKWQLFYYLLVYWSNCFKNKPFLSSLEQFLVNTRNSRFHSFCVDLYPECGGGNGPFGGYSLSRAARHLLLLQIISWLLILYKGERKSRDGWISLLLTFQSSSNFTTGLRQNVSNVSRGQPTNSGVTTIFKICLKCRHLNSQVLQRYLGLKIVQNRSLNQNCV